MKLYNLFPSILTQVKKLQYFFLIKPKPSSPSSGISYSPEKIKKAIIFFLLFWGCLAIMGVLKYKNLHSNYLDLGVALHNISQIANGEWPRIFLSHTQPFIAFWSILHLFFSEEIVATITLISQAALLTLPFIGIYLYFGVIPSIAFLLYFPIWYNGLSDFHIDHLSVPILFAFFFFEKQDKIKLALMFGVLLALVKEPFALQTAFLGFYLILGKKHIKEGTFLVFYGFILFLLSHHYFISFFNSPLIAEIGGINIFTTTNSSFGWLGSSFKEVIIFLITQPHIVIFEIFTNKEKVLYMLYLFGALGFIPLLKPKILVVTIPIFTIALLSNLLNHHSYVHHYTAGLIAPMIMAFSEGLPRAKEIFGKLKLKQELFYPIIISGLFVCHYLLSPSPIGRKFFLEKAWNYHYSVYLPSERSAMIKRILLKVIPKDPNVIISTQNTLVFSHIIQRKITLVFPGGTQEKTMGINTSNLSWNGFIKYVLNGNIAAQPLKKYWADYIILDLKRPWFIVDKGCHWLGERCVNNLAFESEFLGLVENSRNYFDTIFENDGFIILKRRE